MKRLFLLISVMFISLATMISQEKVSLTMFVGDFTYLRTEFDEIEVHASEVDALIGIQNSMDKILTSPVFLEKSDHETLTIDIIKAMANNMLVFMERMTIQGKDAERFQRFRNALKSALAGKTQ